MTPPIDSYVDGVRAGERAVLARAITLIESTSSQQRDQAQELLQRLLPDTDGAVRVGISGVPGVGKSTFIEALGLKLVGEGHRVAVLAVDPSSSVSGGSILGDKSRMDQLAQHDAAYIRPSPSAQSLGGVARRTRESMLMCEAAGFDIVLVETMGVGQSETVVADMVDFFCLLMLPGAGDELQGIKRGIVEVADLIAVNKADGDGATAAKAACADYAAALHYLRPRNKNWKPRAMTISAKTGAGLDELWQTVEEHQEAVDIEGRRKSQRKRWLWSLIDERLREAFKNHPEVQTRLAEAERAAMTGERPPAQLADELLRIFGAGRG